MTLQTMVVDNFFEDPQKIRELILKEEMADVEAGDKVLYPGIVLLPQFLIDDMVSRVEDILNVDCKEALCFARHSAITMTPPHWAHSDKEMCDFVCLIYLNPDPPPGDGTYLVKHHDTGMSTHPQDAVGRELLLADSNDWNKWETTDLLPAKFNRINLINSNLLHAAAPSYGKDRLDSRLVLTVFFRVQ